MAMPVRCPTLATWRVGRGSSCPGHALSTGCIHFLPAFTQCAPRLLGLIHLWIFGIGVNIVFLPMHGLGLAAMPRRIPDYPTA